MPSAISTDLLARVASRNPKGLRNLPDADLLRAAAPEAQPSQWPLTKSSRGGVWTAALTKYSNDQMFVRDWVAVFPV